MFQLLLPVGLVWKKTEDFLLSSFCFAVVVLVGSFGWFVLFWFWSRIFCVGVIFLWRVGIMRAQCASLNSALSSPLKLKCILFEYEDWTKPALVTAIFSEQSGDLILSFLFGLKEADGSLCGWAPVWLLPLLLLLVTLNHGSLSVCSWRLQLETDEMFTEEINQLFAAKGVAPCWLLNASMGPRGFVHFSCTLRIRPTQLGV